MRRALVPVAALALSACAGLLALSLGAGVLPEIDIDRQYEVGDADLTSCPAGDHPVTDSRTGQTVTVHVEPTTGGCLLSFQEDGVLLFDEAQARQASDKLQGREIQGVQAAAVTVKSFSLQDESGAEIDLGAFVTGAQLAVDGETLFTRDDLLALPGEVRKEISGALLDKIISGVESGTPVTVDVAARLEIPTANLPDLPTSLHLQTTLQPEVEVNVADTLTGAAG